MANGEFATHEGVGINKDGKYVVERKRVQTKRSKRRWESRERLEAKRLMREAQALTDDYNTTMSVRQDGSWKEVGKVRSFQER